MSKEKYLNKLRKLLSLGYRQVDVIDIVSDYNEMYEKLLEEGLSDEAVVAKLGSVQEVVTSLNEQKKPDYFIGISKLLELAVYIGLVYLYTTNTEMQFGGSLVHYVIAITIPFSLWGLEERTYANEAFSMKQHKFHLVTCILLIGVVLYNIGFIKVEPWKYMKPSDYGRGHTYSLYASMLLCVLGMLSALRIASLKHLHSLPLLFLYNAFLVFFIAILELCTRLDTPASFYTSLVSIAIPSLLPIGVYFILQLKQVQTWIHR